MNRGVHLRPGDNLLAFCFRFELKRDKNARLASSGVAKDGSGCAVDDTPRAAGKP
jgi:hypothetical protein